MQLHTESYTDVTRATIQGHTGPASLVMQFHVVCKNVTVTNHLAQLQENVDGLKQTLMSSATVLANEKNNPSAEKTTSPEAAEQYATECETLAETLKGLGRELKKLETELGDLTDEDQGKIEAFRDEMSSFEFQMGRVLDGTVAAIEKFYADKANINDEGVRKGMRIIVAEHFQDMKALLKALNAHIKQADPNAPEFPKEMMAEITSSAEPVLKEAQHIVDQRKIEQAEFESKTKTFDQSVQRFRDEVHEELLRKFERVLPGPAVGHVMPLPPPTRLASAA